MILIVSNTLDFATDYVVSGLRKRQVAYCRVDLDRCDSDTIVLDPVHSRLEVCRSGATSVIDGTSVKSVLYRAPTHLRESGKTGYSAEESLRRHQWSAFARGLAVFDTAKWINPIVATFKAETKPLQLLTAYRLGFQVPGTTVTNTASDEVLRRLGAASHVACKSLEGFICRSGEHNLYLYTQLLSLDEAKHSRVTDMPVILQEALAPKLDIRVTVVGDRVFSAAIKVDGKGVSGDWRTMRRVAEVEDHYLPDDISRKCVVLVQSLGLAYGALDFCVVHDKYYFLEINPTGEWLWLPPRMADAVTDAIVNELVQ